MTREPLESHHSHIVSRSVVVQQALNGASAGNDDVLVPQGSASPCSDVLGQDSVDSVQSLRNRSSVAVQQHSGGDVVNNSLC